MCEHASSQNVFMRKNKFILQKSSFFNLRKNRNESIFELKTFRLFSDSFIIRPGISELF